MDSEGFSQAGLNTNRIKKREPVRPHTEERTRNTHAVWPVTDAFDWAMLIWMSTRDVVMLLDDPDVSRAVEQCHDFCRRKETFLVDVND